MIALLIVGEIVFQRLGLLLNYLIISLLKHVCASTSHDTLVV